MYKYKRFDEFFGFREHLSDTKWRYQPGYALCEANTDMDFGLIQYAPLSFPSQKQPAPTAAFAEPGMFSLLLCVSAVAWA